MKVRIASFAIVAISILAPCSSSIASGIEPLTPQLPSGAGTPPAIDWNMPDLKDKTTPKTLVLCSEHPAEQIGLYKSLIEKIGILKGYTILDGSKRNEWTQEINDPGYVVFINKISDNDELQNCIANYPEIKPIITDFIENRIPNQQNVLQKLTRAGALPPGVSPSQCYSRFYYPPVEGRGRWTAYVGIDYSSDGRCIEDFLPNTFGISPISCQSTGICSKGEKEIK